MDFDKRLKKKVDSELRNLTEEKIKLSEKLDTQNHRIKACEDFLREYNDI